ncbi:MAG: hypothetical protein K6F88_02475 [Ruminococcus sp.]|nr:hypothetical protein [Ruminococcus sp.]
MNFLLNLNIKKVWQSVLILQYEASIAFDWSLKRPANAYAGHPHPS